MITDNDQYVFVDGMAKDEDHPHGDLDRIVHDGKLLPVRSGAPVLYGQDVAWISECIAAREYLAGQRDWDNKILFQRIDRTGPQGIPIYSGFRYRHFIVDWNSLFDKSSHLFYGDQEPSTKHRTPVYFKDAFRDILWGNGQYAWKLDDPVNGILAKRSDLETIITSFSSAFLRQYVHVQLPNDDTQPDDSVFWARIQGAQTQQHTAVGTVDDPGPYTLGYDVAEMFFCDGFYTGGRWHFRYQWSYRSQPKILVHIPEAARKIIKSFRLVCGVSVEYDFYNEDKSHGEDGGISMLVSSPVIVGSKNDYTVNVSFDDGITEVYGIDRRQPRGTPSTSPTNFRRFLFIIVGTPTLVADLKDSHTKYM